MQIGQAVEKIRFWQRKECLIKQENRKTITRNLNKNQNS